MKENESLENRIKIGEFSPVSDELRGRRRLRLVETGLGKDDGSNGSNLVTGGYGGEKVTELRFESIPCLRTRFVALYATMQVE
ncbi:hypothetical protein L3X38_026920 [Prunus dulcis]|uniref:Uncharacterized protein n=1 Tax=Prunus dulcis TaxID=3755 RepID=A0AAD4VLY7_PRUDU|nr:hypothetical protein L3X38_026920 [Prunus dulcis]